MREKMPPSLINRPAGTGDYLFMLFVDEVQLKLGHDWRPAPAGTIVFWDRGASHFYGNPARPWSHSWIHCDGRQVDAMLNDARTPRGRALILPAPARIERYLFDLHEEITGFARPSAPILRNILECLLYAAARRESSNDRPPIPENLRLARESIDAGYHQRFTLTVLAARAGLSVPHFCTEFRRHFGMPPITYLIGRRMRVADALLRGTTARIGEIGRQVGYEDPYYFSTHFKRFFGFPPSALRGIDPKRQRTSAARQ
jgi:AraC-like DNA-binding protein